MYNLIVSSFFLFLGMTCLAQNWAGFETGNYAGLNALALQPADLVNSPYRMDINVFSVNATLFGNSALPKYNVFNGGNGSVLADIREVLNIETERYALRSTSMFPSISYSINDESAVAFTWGVRAVGYGRVSELEIKNIFQDAVNNELAGKTYNNEFLRFSLFGWSEFGLSYSRRIWEQDLHRLSAGVSLKLLQGLGEATYDFGNFDLKLDSTNALEYLIVDLDYRYNDQVDQLVESSTFDFFGSSGFGADLGLSYERRLSTDASDNHPGYKYKIGISAVDLGSISFDAAKQRSVMASVENVSLETFSGISNVAQLVDTLERVIGLDVDRELESYRVKMPTRLTFIADYNFGNNIFLNMQHSLLYLNRNFEDDTEKSIYKVTVTPRYETQTYGLYMPISYGRVAKFNTGIALRWKGLSIGSANIISRWLYADNVVVGDLYFSGKFPLMHHRYKAKKKSLE